MAPRFLVVSLSLVALPLFLAACFGPTPPGPEGATIAIAACRAQADRERYDVRQVVGTQQLSGRLGQPVGHEVILKVRRAVLNYDVRCTYTYDDQRARISRI